MPVVLGLNDPWHDSSFCILSPEGMVHVELERFTRSKYEQMNPVLGFVDLYPDLIAKLDHFAIEEGEFLAPHVRRLLLARTAGIEEFVRQIAAQDIGSLKTAHVSADERERLKQFARQIVQSADSVSFHGHHLSHAVNAFWSSDFEDALSITLDGGGLEVIGGKRVTVHGSAWKFARSETNLPQPLRLETASSVGLAWDRVRELVGLKWGEEGTVMAMAAFGKPDAKLEQLVRNDHLWRPHPNELSRSEARAQDRFLREAAANVRDEESRFALARALQTETEIRVCSFLSPFLDHYEGDLCVSGGVFLNCQMTGKIKSWFPTLRRIYIPPAPYDGGISIGNAQIAMHYGPNRAAPSRAAAEFAPFGSGRSYSRTEVIGAVRAHGCAASQASVEEIAARLDAGAVIGLFAGPAESGRRALGHRSILADPRSAAMKDHLNQVIKHRQWFRPFAPMILADKVSGWFDAGDQFASPYMSFALPIRPEKRALVPAIAHQDGTARLQTVHPQLSPGTSRLLQAWERISGIPLLLNTSFNDREPIVQTPADAVATFMRLPLDGLYFGDFGIFATKANRIS